VTLVALVESDVSDERIASFFVIARWFLSPWWWRWYVPPKRRFLQEPRSVTSQKREFFIVRPVAWAGMWSANGIFWDTCRSSWLQTQRFRVQFSALPHFLSSSRSGTGSTQPLGG
jgi:hypothetical protein